MGVPVEDIGPYNSNVHSAYKISPFKILRYRSEIQADMESAPTDKFKALPARRGAFHMLPKISTRTKRKFDAGTKEPS